MSSSSQHQLFMVPETTYGTTPATPALQEYGITGTSIALNKGSIQSERISADRQVKDVRSGTRQTTGSIDFEFAYGAFDALLEALFCGSWTDDALLPGVTRRSFSAVRHFTDLTDGSPRLPWHRYTGLELNTFDLTLAPEAIVKASFGCIGKDIFFEGVAPTGATYPAIDTKRAFDSFLGAITIEGSAVATVTGLTLKIENGLDPRFVLFQDTMNRPKIGKTVVTGNLNLYFETSALLQAFKDSALLDLQFDMLDPYGNAYNWSLPAIFPTGAKVDVSGQNDITIPFPFSAIYNDDAGAALSLTRVPAE